MTSSDKGTPFLCLFQRAIVHKEIVHGIVVGPGILVKSRDGALIDTGADAAACHAIHVDIQRPRLWGCEIGAWSDAHHFHHNVIFHIGVDLIEIKRVPRGLE
jgi:hypothetical protein